MNLHSVCLQYNEPEIAESVVQYLQDVLDDIRNNNLKSVVEFLDRELETLKYIFDSCVRYGTEIEELNERTVFRFLDLGELRDLIVLLTNIRFSIIIDDDRKYLQTLEQLLLNHIVEIVKKNRTLLTEFV